MSWLIVFLAIGCVARFTRLVNGDTLTEPFRKWIETKAVGEEARRRLRAQREEPQSRGPLAFFKRKYRGFWTWLHGLVSCPWCVSVWVSVPIAYIAVFFPTNRFVIGGMLATTASFVASNVIVREPKEE